MKKLILSVAALVMSTAIFAQQKSTDVALITNDVIDFGKVPANIPVTATFIIKNVGKVPLIIESANATCGCTVPEYSKEPIMPGKEATVKGTYNAAQGLGSFVKPIHVKFAGFDDMRDLTIKCEVVSAEDAPKVKTEEKVKTEVKEDKVETKVKTVTPAANGKKAVKKKTKTVTKKS